MERGRGGSAANEEGPSVGRRTVAALVALTFTAGVVDAVTFLALDQVFAANMTGNLVLLGFAVAGAASLSIDGPAVALLAFLAGAATLGRLAGEDTDRARLLRRTVRIETLVVAATVAAAVGFDAGDEGRRLVIVALLAGAMGARNEMIRRISVPELRTTVLTLSIAGLAADEAVGRARSRRDRMRAAGVVAMLAGAILGALLVLETALAWPLVLVVAVQGTVLALLAGPNPARPAADAGDTVSR